MAGRPCQEAKSNRTQKAEVKNENWLVKSLNCHPYPAEDFSLGSPAPPSSESQGKCFDLSIQSAGMDGNQFNKIAFFLPLHHPLISLRTSQCIFTVLSQINGIGPKNVMGFMHLCGIPLSSHAAGLLVNHPGAEFQQQEQNPPQKA